MDETLDERSLELLELPAVLAQLSEYAVTPMGKEAVLGLRPQTRLEEVRRRLERTTQVRRLIEAGGEAARLPLDVPDVRAVVARLRAGGELGPQELDMLARALQELTRLGHHLRRFSEGDGAVAPALAGWGQRIADFTEPVRAIREAVAEDGTVRDSASAELARLRARIRAAQSRVHEVLQQLIRSPVGRRALQEPVITLREGRYVVPVRQECRDLVPGLVHDASASGATLFVEPLAVVEANNELKAARAQEAQEVYRICRELSQKLARHAASMAEALEVCAEVDAVQACARYAIERGCEEPALNDEGVVCLRQARHPLLGPQAVPVDIELGRPDPVLVITGPNAGGKTVAMKTLGLLCAMAACGLPIPARAGSEVAVFRQIWVDIGDPQSVADQLSTFSGHVRRILPILEQADGHTLVLLDELGSGTDPEEGAALAMAILEHLRRRGARVVATTHVTRLKLLAAQSPGVSLASVGFDLERLEPTYQLVAGVPGSSHGLDIARRLGMPAELVARARQYLDGPQVRWESLIAEMQQALSRARQELEQAARQRQEVERLRRQLEQQAAELQARLRRASEQAREQAAVWVRQVREEAAALSRQLKEAAAQQNRQEVERLRAMFRNLQQRVQQGPPLAAAAAGAEGVSAQDGSAAAFSRPDGPVAAGMVVWVESLGLPAVVEELTDDGQAAWVRVGSGRVRVACRALKPAADHPPGRSAPQPQQRPSALQRRASLSPELDLRGLTVDEAVARLEKYLDDCVLAGAERVRVIHGRGTGALRQAVREYLKRCPLVRQFAPAPPEQGGDGATVVELA